MTEQPIEFIVDGIVEDQNVTLIGRCGDEPIALGDEFDAIYRLKPRRYPDELGDPPSRLEEHPVSLRVVAISAYGRSFPILGQGTTGSISVEGAGLDRISSGWLVGRRLAVGSAVGEPSERTMDHVPTLDVSPSQIH